MREFALLFLLLLLSGTARADSGARYELSSQAANTWRLLGLGGDPFLPESIEELSKLLPPSPGCEPQEQDLLERLGDYGRTVARIADEGNSAELEQRRVALLSSFSIDRVKGACARPVYYAYALGSLFLMSPENYDDTYPGFYAPDGRRLPTRLDTILVAAHLIWKGSLGAEALASGPDRGNFLGTYECSRHRVLVDPALPPYRFGRSLIHELRHFRTDFDVQFFDLANPLSRSNWLLVSRPRGKPKLSLKATKTLLLAEEAVASFEGLAALRSLRSYRPQSWLGDPTAGAYRSPGDLDEAPPSSLLPALLRSAYSLELKDPTGLRPDGYPYEPSPTLTQNALGLFQLRGEPVAYRLALEFYRQVFSVYFPAEKFSSVELDVLSLASQAVLGAVTQFYPIEAITRGTSTGGFPGWIEASGERYALPYLDSHLWSATPDNSVHGNRWNRTVPKNPEDEGLSCREFVSAARTGALGAYVGARAKPRRPGDGGVKGDDPDLRACIDFE